MIARDYVAQTAMCVSVVNITLSVVKAIGWRQERAKKYALRI